MPPRIKLTLPSADHSNVGADISSTVTTTGTSRLRECSLMFNRAQNLRGLSSIGLIALLCVTQACSDPERGGANFCAQLNQQLPGLSGPLVISSDIKDLVKRYEKLDRITPLAIQDDWHTVTELMSQAAEVDPQDPLSRQELADNAYKAERPARNVAAWVEATCGFEMPDVIGVEGRITPSTTAAP